MKLNVIIPCYIDQLYPDTAINMVRLFRFLGWEVEYNPDQTCCGQPAFNAGFTTQARQIAQKCYDEIPTDIPTVCSSASCVSFLRDDLPELLSLNEGQDTDDNRTLNVLDLPIFLNQYCDMNRLQPIFRAKAVYHASCSSLRSYQSAQDAKEILKRVEGLELLVKEDEENCCGFGGTFAIHYPDLSIEMLHKKAAYFKSLDIDSIISADWSCLLQLSSYFEKNKIDISCYHLADVLAMNINI